MDYEIDGVDSLNCETGEFVATVTEFRELHLIAKADGKHEGDVNETVIIELVSPNAPEMEPGSVEGPAYTIEIIDADPIAEEEENAGEPDADAGMQVEPNDEEVSDEDAGMQVEPNADDTIEEDPTYDEVDDTAYSDDDLYYYE